MPLINAERIQNIMRKQITSAENNDRQAVSNTQCFKRGDIVDVLLVDACGCVSGVVASGLTVSGICPGESFVFDAAVDTSAPPAGFSYFVESRNINDVQEILDRLCEFTEPQVFPYLVAASISSQSLDTPIVGQGTYELTSDTACFETGDTAQIICDEGIAGETMVVSNNLSSSQVVLDESIDLTSFTNCKLVNTSLTLKQIISRLKGLIANSPVTGECLEDPDCDSTVFEVSQKYITNSSALYWDGNRSTRTDCGTRASLSVGSANDETIHTSLVLGERGNGISIEYLDPAAPSSALAVAVSGKVKDGTKLISVSLETDGGSAIISTALEVAAAINADAEAQRLIQAQYGGTGLDVVSALSSTPLAGGLNDFASPGDYCEIDNVENNLISGTGKKWISLWVLPDEYQYRNRHQSAPNTDEELCIDYTISV